MRKNTIHALASRTTATVISIIIDGRPFVECRVRVRVPGQPDSRGNIEALRRRDDFNPQAIIAKANELMAAQPSAKERNTLAVEELNETPTEYDRRLSKHSRAPRRAEKNSFDSTLRTPASKADIGASLAANSNAIQFIPVMHQRLPEASASLLASATSIAVNHGTEGHGTNTAAIQFVGRDVGNRSLPIRDRHFTETEDVQ